MLRKVYLLILEYLCHLLAKLYSAIIKRQMLTKADLAKI